MKSCKDEHGLILFLLNMKNAGLEIASILDKLCDTTLHLDAENESADIRYNEDDVMNALQIFSHVTGNYTIHRLMDKNGHDMDKADQMIKHYKKLSEWLLKTTGINSRTFYSPKKS